MHPRGSEDSVSAAAAETERLVAWLRLPAIALIAASQQLTHPNPADTEFVVAIVVFSIWSVVLLAWVRLRPVTERLAIVATAIDVVSFAVLASVSGGAFSQARFAFVMIPLTAAFRFRPLMAAIASGFAVAAYVLQAVVHPARSAPDAARLVAVHAGYLAWTGVAAVLLALVLRRRTDRVLQLAHDRERLMADALSVEERERQILADALHDHAIQNLLAARHDLEEVGEKAPHPALARADGMLMDTVSELREAIFELHPYVLEEVGLEAAVATLAQRAARRGRFQLHLSLEARGPHTQARVLLTVARELLANVVAHAEATDVSLRVAEEHGDLTLRVSDNGKGFDPSSLPTRLAEGHIGLPTQRARVEATGGTFVVHAAPGAGTTVEVSLPPSRTATPAGAP